ncbi:MAG: diphosphomevalonate/mevalonate 3,5-bisphosphate decarboxylase family protein [Kordia sp.]|uniref:diphosphomevalonate/mevalonate 3,5-bisphosphate decarboxylase family protein n=1 Tax=Kordia sp. TaxID=1965332 RepID=UPI0038595760
MKIAAFLPKAYTKNVVSGNVTWKSPSNIALIKYWGKKEDQIPQNPSISFTLDACATTTKLSYKKQETTNTDFSFDLFFEGKQKDDFKPKINTFLQRIEQYLPFLKDYHFTIETSNSFPHSSGIASSASGMSALALCLLSLEKELNPAMTDEHFNQKASFLARLGSGSASRSIEGDLIVWGTHEDTVGSSDLFAIKYPYKVHEVFKNYHDTILLVDKGEKQVSSSVGHNLMHNHPFAAERFAQAHENLTKMQSVLADGDLKEFIAIVESEALTLHAMMMTSMPYFILMKPNTLEIINRIWKFRETSGSNVCFTLDAGANVHVLYPENEKDIVYPFIQNELIKFCQNEHHICDRIGFGAKKS